MVIAKADWFERGKYWRVKIKTWQGAVYTGVIGLPILALLLISLSGNTIAIVAYGALFAFYIVDTHDIMESKER